MIINEEIRRSTILVIDDDSTNLSALSRYLSDFGFTVLLAKSGEYAFKILQRRLPDIILLDILIPEIDGFEVCQRLKSDNTTKDIPVIFMSGLTETIDKIKGFEIGAVDYITKPFQYEEVLARVNTHLTIVWQHRQLQEAFANIKTLKGFLPICAKCKKIRDDQGYWKQIEEYIEAHSDALFSHGICPECAGEPSRVQKLPPFDESEPAKRPPRAIVEELLEKAEWGDFTRLEKILDRLEVEDEEYKGFCHRIRAYARRFDDDAIIKYLS